MGSGKVLLGIVGCILGFGGLEFAGFSLRLRCPVWTSEALQDVGLKCRGGDLGVFVVASRFWGLTESCRLLWDSSGLKLRWGLAGSSFVGDRWCSGGHLGVLCGHVWVLQSCSVLRSPAWRDEIMWTRVGFLMPVMGHTVQ